MATARCTQALPSGRRTTLSASDCNQAKASGSEPARRAIAFLSQEGTSSSTRTRSVAGSPRLLSALSELLVGTAGAASSASIICSCWRFISTTSLTEYFCATSSITAEWTRHMRTRFSNALRLSTRSAWRVLSSALNRRSDLATLAESRLATMWHSSPTTVSSTSSLVRSTRRRSQPGKAQRFPDRAQRRLRVWSVIPIALMLTTVFDVAALIAGLARARSAARRRLRSPLTRAPHTGPRRLGSPR